MLTTSSYFDNLQFEIDAGSPQCHFIMSDAIVVRIRMNSAHYLNLNFVRYNRSKPFKLVALVKIVT